MDSDLGWFFTTEWGRDQRLRSELQSQAAQMHASAARTARLRSQLARLQGSVDRRLSALATAFDAYVELGDVREELADLPSSAPVRRRARDAMATLRAGHNPTPLPEGQAGHWLGGAMNRVIDAVRRDVPLSEQGPHDTAASTIGAGYEEHGRGGFGAGDRVLTGSRDARIFETLTLGMLGYGDRAVDGLPALLTTDGGFTIEQAVLFVGVMEGKFGPNVLPSLREVMVGNIARSEQTNWNEWLVKRAGRGRIRTLEWVLVQTAPVPDLPDVDEGAQPIEVQGYAARGESTSTPMMDADEMFERLVDEMIDEGSPMERELIHRAASLRARIEDADATIPTPRWDHDPVPVGQVVREAFEGALPGTTERRELFSWMLPHLREPIEEALRPDEDTKDVVVKARTPGGSVEVRRDGPDRGQLERVRATIAERYGRPPLSKGLLGAAGALLVLGVAGFAGLGPVWWAITALVIAVGLAGLALWQVRPGDRAELRAGEDSRTDKEIADARERVEETIAEQEALREEHRRLAATVRERLTEVDDSFAADGVAPDKVTVAGTDDGVTAGRT